MIRINQSSLKAVFTWDYDDESYTMRDNICPKCWKGKYMDGKKTSPSQAQMMGIYMEYITGVNPDAQIKMFPMKKGTTKYIDHERMDRQADMFRGICKEKKITLSNVQITMEHWYVKDRIQLHGTMDILDRLNGKDTNIDMKVTSSLKHDFGEFQWSDPSKKDFLQAKFYDYLFFMNKGKHMDHMFLVFDYSPEMNYNEITYEIGDMDHKQVEYLVDSMCDLVLRWHAMKYPANPSPELCRQCPFGYREPNKFEKATLELNGIIPMYGDKSCEDRV